LQGQRGEVEADRPSLGRIGELGGLDPRGAHAGTAEQPIRLARAQGEVLDADLEQPTVGAQARQPDVGDGPPCERELRTVGDVAGDRRHRVDDQRLREPVEIVQHEHERLGPRGERRAEPREHPRRRGTGRRRDGVEHGRFDPLDPIERDRDVSRNTTGSPSASSTEIHANGRRSRSAHSASRVVLP
jgi:hypothetical protein